MWVMIIQREGRGGGGVKAKDMAWHLANYCVLIKSTGFQQEECPIGKNSSFECHCITY